MAALLPVIIGIAVAPMISVMVAGSIAKANGCVLHEGFVNPCVVDGKDMGETLYAMGMMGWLMIATIPAGIIALIVWLIVATIMLVTGRRSAPPAAGAS
ncbi:hypothetical protein [Bauldia litoralis]|nr:hypothetical protein [Bauldia litoralis]